MDVIIGCCGFHVARGRYFKEFPVVEVQQTFYQPPALSTAEKWRKEAPEGFEFTIKAWQLITHEPKSPTYRRLKMKIPESKHNRYGAFRPTEEVIEAWNETARIAGALGAGIIVFQCPSSFVPSEENKKNMERFFSSIDRKGLILAWEPRGRWTEGEIESICRGLDLIHVVDPFKSRPVYGEINYFRLHGITGYKYKFTRDDLMRLRDMVLDKKSYVMFNNVHMYEDAVEFKGICNQTR